MSFGFHPHDVPEGSTEIDREVLDLMNRYKVVGLSIHLIKEGKIFWSNSYGWADLGRKIPVRKTTFFRVASISKTVVATALMQQYEQGKFRLDDDIGDALGFPVRNPHHPREKITYRHLLTHTTGLRSDEETGEVYVRYSMACQCNHPPSLREVFLPGGAFYTHDLWSPSKPGESFAYSNLGTIILATLLERWSGKRMDLYCKDHIFAPLGMTRSSFHLLDFQNMDDLAVLYEYDPAQNRFTVGTDDLKGRRPESLDLRDYVPGTTGAVFSPQGGLRTTSGDLAQFLLAHMNDGEHEGVRILSPDTARLMHQTHFINPRSGELFRKIGLQFHITEEFVPGKRMIGHSGEAYGLLSTMYFHKEERFGIIFIMNGSAYREGRRSGFFDVEEALAELLYQKQICG